MSSLLFDHVRGGVFGLLPVEAFCLRLALEDYLQIASQLLRTLASTFVLKRHRYKGTVARGRGMRHNYSIKFKLSSSIV